MMCDFDLKIIFPGGVFIHVSLTVENINSSSRDDLLNGVFVFEKQESEEIRVPGYSSIFNKCLTQSAIV